MQKYCSDCGKEINENADFCVGCGKKLTNVQSTTSTISHICPKCNSNNISIQIVNKVKLANKHHGLFWWLFIGWWWLPIKWLIFTVPALIFKIFGIGKRYKTKNIEHKTAVCQNCGNSWKI